MSKEDYERGVRDGEKNSNAGNPTKNVLSELVEGYSKEELESIKDYKQGHEHGWKNR